MITQNDLLDLHMIMCYIRNEPLAEENHLIVKTIKSEMMTDLIYSNKFRCALSNLGILDRNKWEFVYHKNVYAYTVIMKESHIYDIILELLEALQVAIEQKNKFKIYDLSDMLHMLPVMIIENNYRVPRSFFKKNVSFYKKSGTNIFLSNSPIKPA